MLRPWRLPLLLLLAFSLGGCGGFRPASDREVLLEYRVVAGDTLYSIAWRYGYDYREVAAWNHIKPPYRINIGQKLKIIAPFLREVRPRRRVATVPHSPQPTAAPRASAPRIVPPSSGKATLPKGPTVAQSRPQALEKPPSVPIPEL